MDYHDMPDLITPWVNEEELKAYTQNGEPVSSSDNGDDDAYIYIEDLQNFITKLQEKYRDGNVEYAIQILNVAGPRHLGTGNIEQFVYEVLDEILKAAWEAI